MLSKIYQWLTLLVFSIFLIWLLTWLGIPAALLLGPIIAGVAITAFRVKIQPHKMAYSLAQGFTGCMIAQMVSSMKIGASPETSLTFFVLGALSVVALSILLSLVMMRMQILSGTTIAWGLSPGAATAMTILADNYGADTQIVAFMQYLRVLMVAIIASTVSKFLGINTAHDLNIIWFPEINWQPFIQTIFMVIACCSFAHILRFKAGGLLLSLIAGIILTKYNLITLELPRWLLAISYAFIGWRIGLRFTPELLKHTLKTLPKILFCTLTLIGLCGLLAYILVVFWNIAPLTAYLATSPGGADTVAIIAASTNVDADFVMTMQVLRFMCVIFLSPFFAKIITRGKRRSL